MPSNLFDDYTIEKKLNSKGNVFLLSKDGGKFVGKLKQKPRRDRGYLFYLVDKLGLLELQFQEEIFFLKTLGTITFKHLNYPKLVKATNNYFITKYIEGRDGEWKPCFQLKSLFTKILVDFQLSANELTLNWRIKMIAPLFSPTGSVLRLSITNGIKYSGFRSAVKSLILALKLDLRNQRQEFRFLIHGDLIPAPRSTNGLIYSKNLIFTASGNIYIIDFELPVISRKFFLSDMVDIAFNFEEESLDWDWLMTFVKEQKTRVLIKGLKIEDQIRIALLRNVLSKMILKKWRIKYSEFYKNTLLIDENYHSWLERQKVGKSGLSENSF